MSWLQKLRALIPKEARILLATALAVGAVLAFAKLASEIGEGDTKSFDELVLTSLRRPADRAIPIGPAWLTGAALDLTALGSSAVLSIIILAVLGNFALQRRWALALETLAATVGGELLGVALKSLFGRERPTIVPHLQHVTSASFPSGHSMLSAIVYLTLGAMLARAAPTRTLRVYYVLVAMALSFIVGITRIYLGVHYPSDVAGGWLAGLAWAALCALGVSLYERRARGGDGQGARG